LNKNSSQSITRAPVDSETLRTRCANHNFLDFILDVRHQYQVQWCNSVPTMTSLTPKKAVLTCHPQAHSRAVQEIEVGASWTQDNALLFTYALKADLTRLRIPPPRPPGKADRLWQHTCFEAFVSVKGKAEYYEFNFAPSGEWAAYSFQRYRDATPLEDDTFVPRITVRNATAQLDLDAIIRLDRLPMIEPHAWLRLGLSAVIEDQSGKLSYWALRHPPGKPDFHHPDCFALNHEPANVGAANKPAIKSNEVRN
jgi:hypothetical protein